MAEAGVVERVQPNRAPDATNVGMVVWLASELMFFAGLFAAWFMIRSVAETFPPKGITLPVARTAVATAILVASSGAIHMAVVAGRNHRRGTAVRWLVITSVMGLVFLSAQVYEYATADFHMDTDAYGSIFYLMTGIHGLHVLGGIVFLLSIAGVIAGRSRAPAERTVEMAAYYWHFVDVVWVCMFLTIYVIQ